GGVEDVDLVPVVLGEGHAEVDGDVALLFLRLEVGGRRRLVGGAQSGDGAGGEEHRLGEHGLAVVRVAQQDHVADLFGGVVGHPNPPEIGAAELRNPSLRLGRNRPGRMASPMVKKTASIEEVLAAIEAARDKVMADEVKSLTKLGIPKAMAYQMIASRFHQELADRAGVSERTLRRDLAQLRELGYEVAYTSGYEVQERLNLEGRGKRRPRTQGDDALLQAVAQAVETAGLWRDTGGEVPQAPRRAKAKRVGAAPIVLIPAGGDDPDFRFATGIGLER